MNETQLPAPDAPFSALEERLARIWCEVIRVDTVTRADDFFDLGAHSLLITHIINHVRKEFVIDLTMRDFLDAARFGEFCALVAQKLKLAALPISPPAPARAA